MGLSIQDQYDLIVNQSFTQGDFDLGAKVLLSPDAVTYGESRSFGEKLGVKGGFLEAAANLVTDPTLLVALLLSRAYPTAQYLKGTIPKRFIGLANEFTGISSVGRTVEGFFRGTTVPPLVYLKMRREAEVAQIGNKIFDQTILRPNWQAEKPIVSLLLEGQNPEGATQELRTLATGIRNHMDDLWGLLSKTWQVEGGFSGDKVTYAKAQPFAPDKAPKYLRDYLPHIPLLGDESVMTLTGQQAMRKFGLSRSAQAMDLVGVNPANIWRVTDGRLESNYQAFQSFMQTVGTQVFNPRLFHRQRMGTPIASGDGSGLFVSDLDIVLQKYIHGVARTYALNAPLSAKERAFASVVTETGERLYPSEQPIAVQLMNEGLKTAGANRVVQRPVIGTNVVEETVDTRTMNAPTLGALRTLMRGVMGRADESEILTGTVWGAVRRKVNGLFKGAEAAKLEDSISVMERQAMDRQSINRLTSFFYASTLGVNPASAIKNLFQPALTTVPAIGIGPTLAGYQELKARLPVYARNFINERRALAGNPSLNILEQLNTAQDRAFRMTFPELARANLKIDPRAYELSEAQLLVDKSTGKGVFAKLDDFNRFLLQPFQQTELSNQIVTFYGGKRALLNATRTGQITPPHLPEGGGPMNAVAFNEWLDSTAGDLVGSLQFRPSPGSRTPLQAALPPPFRMFTSFPVRFANHLIDSTVRGAIAEKNVEQSFLTKMTGGRNLGTLARTYVMGRVTTEGMKAALGVDISDAVGLTGPFTGVVESGRIFPSLTAAPLPSVVYGLASFSSTRDLRDLQPMELPLVGQIPVPKTLVPGGVAISRASKVLRSYRPDLGGFVDDDERLMYRGDTQDAMLAAFGIPLDKERRTRLAMDRIAANRMRIKQYRRRLTLAAVNNDFAEMDKLQAGYREEFPDMGELGVSHRDVQRYQESQRMTGVERMVNALGKSGEMFRRDIYEVDPELLSNEVY